jgi:anti-sigma factor RsiW
MTELNDELLVAYVDGQLAEDQSKAIERVLEEDQVAAERVEALRAANAHLETAFESMIAGEAIPVLEDVPEASVAGTTKSRTFGSILRRSALFAWVGFGCFLGGSAAGYILYDQISAEPFQTVVVTPPLPATEPAPVPVAIPAPPPDPTFADDVARTHALLSPETFSFGLESEGNMDLASFQISKTLGVGFSIPDLSSQKLTFHRAQMLQREAKPFTQIAYLANSGVPVGLYATAYTGKPEAMQLDEKDGINLATWTQGGLSLLLAGNLPEARLQELAKAVESHLAAEEPKAQDTGALDITPATTEAEPASANQ